MAPASTFWWLAAAERAELQSCHHSPIITQQNSCLINSSVHSQRLCHGLRWELGSDHFTSSRWTLVFSSVQVSNPGLCLLQVSPQIQVLPSFITAGWCGGGVVVLLLRTSVSVNRAPVSRCHHQHQQQGGEESSSVQQGNGGHCTATAGHCLLLI